MIKVVEFIICSIMMSFVTLSDYPNLCGDQIKHNTGVNGFLFFFSLRNFAVLKQNVDCMSDFLAYLCLRYIIQVSCVHLFRILFIDYISCLV